MNQKDGFSTLLTFSLNNAVKMSEKDVTPPGLDAGGGIDQTTMRNTKYRTMAPKSLITVSDAAATVAYDSALYPQIVAMLGINQQITTTFPDSHTLITWGWIDSFKPGSNKEGTQPTATISIVPSNMDNSGVEQAPVYA